MTTISPYEKLIQSYIDNQYGLDEQFISSALSGLLQVRLYELLNTDKLFIAGTGNAALVHHDNLLRSDKIYWLDRANNNFAENAFLDIIDAFILYLNNTCYSGITGYEFHFALYEAGSFYTKHYDRFAHNGDRAFSMITYVNPNWCISDGGELQIHTTDTVQQIAPINCTCVFFKSDELEHEVLITNVPRLSITGWLKTN